jgi:hypothetical protein
MIWLSMQPNLVIAIAFCGVEIEVDVDGVSFADKCKMALLCVILHLDPVLFGISEFLVAVLQYFFRGHERVFLFTRKILYAKSIYTDTVHFVGWIVAFKQYVFCFHHNAGGIGHANQRPKYYRQPS